MYKGPDYIDYSEYICRRKNGGVGRRPYLNKGKVESYFANEYLTEFKHIENEQEASKIKENEKTIDYQESIEEENYNSKEKHKGKGQLENNLSYQEKKNSSEKREEAKVNKTVPYEKESGCHEKHSGKSKKTRKFDDKKTNSPIYGQGDSNGKRNCREIKPYKRRERGYTIVVIIAIIVMVFSIYLVKGDSIMPIPSWLETDGTGTTFYAIEVGYTYDISSARVLAEEYRKKGGAGLILNDGGYRIIIAVYLSLEECNAVLEKIKTDVPDAKAYAMSAPNLKLNTKQYTKKADYEEALRYYYIIYNKLYELSNMVQSKTTNSVEIKVELRLLREEIFNLKTDFCAAFSTGEMDSTYVKVNAELTAAVAILDNLINSDTESDSFLSDMRYSYVLIVNNYVALMVSL